MVGKQALREARVAEGVKECVRRLDDALDDRENDLCCTRQAGGPQDGQI